MGFPASNINEAPATAQTVPERDRPTRSQYEQDTSTSVGAPMSIQRVPEVPFAQIANEALRDKRLSFKARGVLALVLSNVGEWEATLRWLCKQSDKDGRHAVQQALNELTELGYRHVTKAPINGLMRTIVEWKHTADSTISRPTENPTVGKPDRHKTRASIEHHPLEHHHTEQHQEEQAQPKTDLFDHFWTAYPRKAGKGAARKAWAKAVTKTDTTTIIAAALQYSQDPNRDDEFTAHASTWLNAERWDDEPLPGKASEQSKSEQRLRRNVSALNRWGTVERKLEPLEIDFVQSGRKELGS